MFNIAPGHQILCSRCGRANPLSVKNAFIRPPTHPAAAINAAHVQGFILFKGSVESSASRSTSSSVSTSVHSVRAFFCGITRPFVGRSFYEYDLHDCDQPFPAEAEADKKSEVKRKN
jgi:hypothetical protein